MSANGKGAATKDGCGWDDADADPQDRTLDAADANLMNCAQNCLYTWNQCSL